MDFDTLFSQNTWSFSQALDKEHSADLVKIDKRQSVKRKRSEIEDLVHLKCPPDENKHEAQLQDKPVSPGRSHFACFSLYGRQARQYCNYIHDTPLLFRNLNYGSILQHIFTCQLRSFP